jgi:hypothetical protein
VRPLLILVAIVAVLLGSLGHAPAARAATPIKVAIIVGPVGDELTPVYISLAEAAATSAEARGATVAEAFSPDATAENVLKAIEGANVVIYFGHGVGSPNPYSDTPNPETTNGWGLNGPNAKGHADSWKDGSLTYYGEAWIAKHAKPAPGWVMIYSNACYAPGAGEGFDDPATEEVAASRVAAYSRAPLADLGASAYFATDFFEGAADLIGTLLDQPDLPYGDIFAAEPRFDAKGLVTLANPLVDGTETWLQKSPYFEGKSDYWYAFAGDPAASLSGAVTDAPPIAPAAAIPPLAAVDGLVTGKASSYSESPGWEGKATVALPVELGGGIPHDQPANVLVCADRCVTLPVVDSCPCYVGTPDQRVANLSLEAWRQVTDLPIEEGLVQVQVYLDPIQLPPDDRPAA